MKSKSFARKVLLKKRKRLERESRERLMANSNVWGLLQEYLAKTKSTGCSYTDYRTLYDYVRQHKPAEVLECGTGVSTIIIAAALLENAKDGVPGRVTSLEDQEKYFELAQQLLPESVSPVVNLCLRPKKEYAISFYRGVGYEDLPPLPYDFVFIDGPDYDTPGDGHKTFDFDFLNVLMNSTKPVSAILDGRLSTAYVFQKILGEEKVRYDPITQQSFIGPCSKSDIRIFENDVVFKSSIRLYGLTRFHFDGGKLRK